MGESFFFLCFLSVFCLVWFDTRRGREVELEEEDEEEEEEEEQEVEEEHERVELNSIHSKKITTSIIHSTYIVPSL